MNPISRLHATPTWTACLPQAPASAPAASPVDAFAGTLGPQAVQAPAPSSAAPLRDPEAAVRFCDTFNGGLGLPPEELAGKAALMGSGPLKLARCMPALFMSDVLGPYADLAKLSDRRAPVVWIQGDCHLGNFGIVQSRHGHAVWGLNDFDATSQGSPAMDLGRLAFSLVSAMRERGLRDTGDAVAALSRAYRKEMGAIADGDDRGEAYLNAKQASGSIRQLIERSDAIERADWIQRYAARGRDGEWRFVYGDGLEAVDPHTSRSVSDALHAYDQQQGPTPAVQRPLQLLGVARKLDSGGSSFGQPRYFALVANADGDQPPIVLEVKQELPAPLVGWTGDNEAARRASRPNWAGDLRRADATQVVRGQLAMGGDQNPLSGTTSIDGISYLVREREPCKATLGDKHLATVDDFVSLASHAGTVLARAHGRSELQAKGIVAWMGDKGTFTERLDAFAQAYAKQAEADVAAFRAAHPPVS